MCKYIGMDGSQEFSLWEKGNQTKNERRCSREHNGPQDVHMLIPRTCEYDTLHGKRDFAEVTMDTDPGCRRSVLSGRVKSNPMSP